MVLPILDKWSFLAIKMKANLPFIFLIKGGKRGGGGDNMGAHIMFKWITGKSEL